MLYNVIVIYFYQLSKKNIIYKVIKIHFFKYMDLVKVKLNVYTKSKYLRINEPVKSDINRRIRFFSIFFNSVTKAQFVGP